MDVERLENNREIAKLMAILIQNTFKNQILLGDLHAPMNKIADAYKILSNGEMIGGFAIYKGSQVPSIPFPYGQTKWWPTIRQFIDDLGFEKVYLPYPIGLESNPSVSPPPHLGWNSYTWQVAFTDYAMRFTKEELTVMSIKGLPTIDAVKNEDVKEIKEFLTQNNMVEWFHPFQVESELAVVARDNDKIVGFAGTHFETPYTVQLGNVVVAPEFRRKGLGSALVTAVMLGIIRTRRVPTLFVNEHNAIAIKFYKKLGFEPYDRFRFFFGIRGA